MKKILFTVLFALTVSSLVSCGDILSTTVNDDVSNSTVYEPIETTGNISTDSAVRTFIEQTGTSTSFTLRDTIDQIMQIPPDTVHDILSNIDNTDAIEPSKDSGEVDRLPAVGVIYGDVYYKDIAISSLLGKSPEDVEAILGSPNPDENECGFVFFYDDMQVFFYPYSSDGDSDNDWYVGNIYLVNWTQNMRLFELNGVTLYKSREDLISEFGNPVEYFEYSNHVYHSENRDDTIRYHICSTSVDYTLDFWFFTDSSPDWYDTPDEITYGCDITYLC